VPRTLSDLVTEALHDDFDRTKYGGRAQQAILDAISEVSRAMRLPGSERTYTVPVVAGTADYSLPSDFMRVLDVSRTADATRLVPLSPEELDEEDTATGTPVGFSTFGTTLTLYPTPNAAVDVRLRYLRELSTPNVNDSVASVTGLPESGLDALVSFARSKLFRFEDDPEMSGFWRAEYQRDLNRLRGDLGFSPNTRRQVPNTNIQRL